VGQYVHCPILGLSLNAASSAQYPHFTYPGLDGQRDLSLPRQPLKNKEMKTSKINNFIFSLKQDKLLNAPKNSVLNYYQLI